MSGGLSEAGTDLDRKKHVERISRFPPKFLELAEKYPGDPIALKALRQAVQVINTADSAALNTWNMNRSEFPDGSAGGDESIKRAVNLLLRNYIRSEGLGPVVDRARYGYRLEHEKFLSAALRENPDRKVEGLACLSLARFLNDKLRMLQLAEDRPELTKRYEILFGKGFLPEIERLKRAGLARRIETLFERAAGEYADVETLAGGTAGEKAGAELYEIRHLAIGKVAPETVGIDQDGVEFKLSAYLGKVVLLYFWIEF